MGARQPRSKENLFCDRLQCHAMSLQLHCTHLGLAKIFTQLDTCWGYQKSAECRFNKITPLRITKNYTQPMTRSSLKAPWGCPKYYKKSSRIIPDKIWMAFLERGSSDRVPIPFRTRNSAVHPQRINRRDSVMKSGARREHGPQGLRRPSDNVARDNRIG